VLGNWNFTGYVTAKDVVLDWLASELGGLGLKDVARAMHDHVQNGGAIDQVVERRQEWSAWPFHYDFRLLLAGRLVYIETILQDDDPKDPTLHIVSMHDV
jgi:hypothetical protein